MRVSIRPSKYQKEELTTHQLRFAAECAGDYMLNKYDKYRIYQGAGLYSDLSCDIYRTKTQISAVVYFKG